LLELFELDDDTTEYINPFSNPKELMENFQNLEEKNLTLIRQNQETDE
jgi:septal ring factor EnvC (AmiA/AmiB activator)